MSSETPAPDASRTFVEHNRQQQRRRAFWDRNEQIRETVEKCSRCLELGQAKHYHYIATALDETLVPLLLTEHGKTPRSYADALADHPEWHYLQLKQFVDDPTPYLEATNPTVATPSGVEATARATVTQAFDSLAAIAEEEEIIRAELRTRVDATMFGRKIGEHLQDAEMDLGDSVEAMSLLSGALKTVHTGGTGQGKSAGVEAEAEAYYRQTFQSGRDYKLIDPVGLRDGENWFYDIPLREETLRRRRDEQGLAPSFAEDPDVEPDEYPQVELYVPLTPGLSDEELPFDVDSEQFVVTPYTVPAADIRKRLLISIMATKLTPQQEATVRTAYSEVDTSHDDWTLATLADEVLHRDDLDESKTKPIVATLRQLQQQGFIRTRDDPHTLAWRDIFTDSETITVFSQAFIDDEVGQLIAAGHLIETIVNERESMYGIPEVVLPIRELWKVAPHNRRQSFDARAAALQESIGHMLTELFRENRHSGVHMMGDTQFLSDLLKSIRELFNRYVVYNTNRDTVQDIFEWTANDKWGSFYSTLSPQPGEGSVVGMVQPAVEERDIEFVGPVQYAGPSHHHFDEDSDQTGWRSRERYLSPITECPECESDALERTEQLDAVICADCGERTPDLSLGREEELRRPRRVDDVEWDDEVPTKLRVNVGTDEEDSTPDIDREPVELFAQRCLRKERDSDVKKEDVRTAFNEFMLDHDRSTRDFDDHKTATRFGQRLASALDYWDEIGRSVVDGRESYRHMALTTAGQEYLSAAYEGLEDSAAPVTDR